MKHIKKHIKNISKQGMKKILSGLVILFFAMVMIFQRTETTPLQFVRNMDEEFLHNAPNTQRDYLFEDEQGQEVYQWQLWTWSTDTTTTSDNIDTLVNPNELEDLFDDLINNSGQRYTGNIISTWVQQKTWITSTWSLDCIAPWGEKVKNKDFILAYEQRKDVNTICNIEKRVCMNGILGGSFKQESCKDDIVYEYNKAEIVSYNQKILNEYIQPIEMTKEEQKAYNELIQPKPPMNSWAEFNTQGQLQPEKEPTTSRWTTSTQVTTQPEVEQESTPSKKSCSAPRWQKINHGQFVKAYKAPRGFVDLACEVELRACVDGTLKGNFRYATCAFNNTTYSEYLNAGSPTSNTGFLFFERIKNIFRRWR